MTAFGGRRKFGNHKVGGFDSKKEARRGLELKLMERGGLISDLKMQVKFEIIPKCGKERAAHWVADFTYLENGVFVCEDVKGLRLPLYILKRKLMQTVHGIVIRET